MDNIREKILLINRRTDIDISEKNRLISQLMMNNYSNKNKRNTDIVCSHYERNYVELNVLNVNVYILVDFVMMKMRIILLTVMVVNMVCNYCDKLQKCSQTCTFCDKSMSNYYCDVCKLFSSDENIKHCDKCGICRVGKDTTHCDKCNMCINNDAFEDHKCIDCFDNICPICQEDIRTSREPNTILKCNHVVHIKCLKQSLSTHNYQCPLCKKSMADMTYLWEQEKWREKYNMPEEFENMESKILCNDCLERQLQNITFHTTNVQNV